MSATDVDAALCAAVHRNDLDAAIAGLSRRAVTEEGRARIHAAEASLRAVRQGTAALREDLSARFRSAGITLDAQPEADRLFQKASFRIAPEDLAAALGVAEAAGFPVAGVLSKGAVAGLRHWGDHVGFLRPDAVCSRLDLRWRPSRLARLTPHRLRPNLSDYMFADLPGAVWPFYGPLKGVRAYQTRRGRASGRAVLTAAGLGTPLSLVAPLAEMAGITRDDHLVDVGCGDGRFLIEAVTQLGCRATGTERDPGAARLAEAAVQQAGLGDRITIRSAPATPEQIAQASVVFTFQPPGDLARILSLVLPNLAVGARFLTHEQLPLPPGAWPDLSRFVAGADALTVAHMWTGPVRPDRAA